MEILQKPIVEAMLTLQGSMNAKINPNWLTANYPFLRAALVESVEALDHYGWKWWKANKPDFEQVRLELIDIWHFVLSHYLVENKGNITGAATQILNEWKIEEVIRFDEKLFDIVDMDLRDKFELIAASFALRKPTLPLVLNLFESCNISSQGLYTQYVCKNVLNHFRQDRGYKVGSYMKFWDKKEDNEEMQRIVAGLDANSATLPEELYIALDRRYEDLKKSGRLSN